MSERAFHRLVVVVVASALLCGCPRSRPLTEPGPSPSPAAGAQSPAAGSAPPDARLEARAVVKVRVPFEGTRAVNGLGVGKPCTLHADCRGQAAASCPQAISPKLPNWCTRLCSVDPECGENAFCWIRPSREGGMVGSCAPNAARLPD